MAETDKQQAMMRFQELQTCVLALATGAAIFAASAEPGPLRRALPLFIAAAAASAVLVVTRVLIPRRPGASWPVPLLRIALLAALVPVEWQWGSALPALPVLYPAAALFAFWTERPWRLALTGALAGAAHGAGRWLSGLPAAATDVWLPALLVAVATTGIGLMMLAWTRLSRESARLTEQRLAAAERLAHTGTLAAMAAHEIRGPLTSVKGFLQMLQRRLHGHEDAKWVELIRRDVDRVERLVREFLILGSPRPPRPVLTPVLPLLEESVRAALLPEPGRETLDVTVACPAELEWPLDREQLRQVLVNVIRNAAEATHPQGRIHLEAAAADGQLTLTVTDTGCGIPPEQLEQVLEPFFTTKRAGTGLGLAICKQLIANHGGMLSIQSEGESGTTVTVRLGALPPQPEEIPRPVAASGHGASSPKAAPPRSAATAMQRLRLMGRRQGKHAPRPAALPARAPRAQGEPP